VPVPHPAPADNASLSRQFGACHGKLMTKADLHGLVDELPDNALDGAAFFLERLARAPLTPIRPGFGPLSGRSSWAPPLPT